MSEFDYAIEKKRHRKIKYSFVLLISALYLINSRNDILTFEVLIGLVFTAAIAVLIGHFLANAVAMPFVSYTERKVTNQIQLVLGLLAFLIGFIAFLVLDSIGPFGSFGMGLIYGIIGVLLGNLVGRIFNTFKSRGNFFPESEKLASINRLLFFGFGLAALMSAFMFTKAFSANFSPDEAFCLTRSGQTCLESLNPIWTAQTLGWLAPTVLVVSLIGLALMKRMKNYWPTSLIGLALALLIALLALSQEIEDRNEWIEGISKHRETI